MAFPLLPIISSISSALKVPSIAIFIGQIAANVLSWFATKMTRSLAINLTIIALVVSIASGTALLIYTLAAGLSYVVPSYISQAFSLFVPDNAVPCLSVIFSARVIRWVWTWQVYAINKASS